MAEKICRNHLKIADIIDFNDGIFYRRTFLLIQRIVIPIKYGSRKLLPCKSLFIPPLLEISENAGFLMLSRVIETDN